MDLIKIIYDLRQEREKLQAIISSLEQLQLPGLSASYSSQASSSQASRRRGRRSMDAAGRLEVSRRMKQYWEKRRNDGELNGGSNGNGRSVIDSLSI